MIIKKIQDKINVIRQRISYYEDNLTTNNIGDDLRKIYVSNKKVDEGILYELMYVLELFDRYHLPKNIWTRASEKLPNSISTIWRHINDKSFIGYGYTKEGFYHNGKIYNDNDKIEWLDESFD